MTPAQIELAARRKYNAVNSTFFATAEIYDLIYQAELEAATETKMLEGRTVIAGGSVAGTQEYDFPDDALEIKRIEYDGQKLQRIDFRDDDNLTLFDSNSTAQGKPLAYYVWDRTIYFRPIPNASAEQIRVYFYKLPSPVTSASQVLEIPTNFHMGIVDYVLAEMAAKDKQFDTAKTYFEKWYGKHIPSMIKWYARSKRGDSFKTVKTEDQATGAILGST